MSKIKDGKISFKYKISPNYMVHYITGAHGGLNAKGDIIMNCYAERASIPKTETFKIGKDGRLSSPPIETDNIDEFVRDVYFAIAINPEDAKAMADWLYEKVEQHKALMREDS